MCACMCLACVVTVLSQCYTAYVCARAAFRLHCVHEGIHEGHTSAPPACGCRCWGGDATTVNCNGPNEAQNDADMFYGKVRVRAAELVRGLSDWSIRPGCE